MNCRLPKLLGRKVIMFGPCLLDSSFNPPTAPQYHKFILWSHSHQLVTNSRSPSLATTKRGDKASTYWSTFLDDGCDGNSDAVADESDLVSKELDLYASLPPLTSKDDDPLAWWKANCQNFPCLAQLAKRYLSIPATSVASERAFSGAGNVVTAKRNCLKPATVNQLCFLAANL